MKSPIQYLWEKDIEDKIKNNFEGLNVPQLIEMKNKAEIKGDYELCALLRDKIKTFKGFE